MRQLWEQAVPLVDREARLADLYLALAGYKNLAAFLYDIAVKMATIVVLDPKPEDKNTVLDIEGRVEHFCVIVVLYWLHRL